MWYYFEWLNCKQRTRINVSNKNISERNHKAVRVLITESKYTKIYLLICYLLLWPLRHQSRSMFSGDCGRRMWSSVCRSTWRSQPAWVLRDAPSYRTPGGIARREAVGWRYNFLFLFFYFFILPPETYLQCVYIGKITIDTKNTWRGSPKETIGLIWIELPQQRMSSYLDLFNCKGGKLRIQTHVTHTRHRKFLGEKE